MLQVILLALAILWVAFVAYVAISALYHGTYAVTKSLLSPKQAPDDQG